MRPMLKATIALLVVLVVFYAVITMLKGVAMVRTGGAVGVFLGLAVLVIPLLGLALVLRELWFGRQCARLTEELEREGGLPVAELADLPRRPSGRGRRALREGARGGRGRARPLAGLVPPLAGLRRRRRPQPRPRRRPARDRAAQAGEPLTDR